MKASTMTYGDVQVAPYELVHLLTLKVVKTVNEHARLIFTGIIPEEKRDSYVNQTNSNTHVKVMLTDKSGKPKVWFQGIVLNVRVQSIRGIYHLAVEAVSHTYALDVKKRKRSFQNPSMSYNGLVQTVISAYDKADVIDVATNGQAIRSLVMQYEETDWQFLKRMASRFYTALVPASGFDIPKFYVGIPLGQDKGALDAVHYTVKKRIADYRNASENRVPGIDDGDYTVYEVESRQLLELGNEVKFKSRRLVVGEAVTEMKDGILTNTYKLFPRKGLQQKKKHNNAIIGASIQGRVIQVRNDTVRAKLDMDDQQDESTAYWFPYSTIYASENNTGWYCMPEVNDHIRIYFPSNKEDEGIAISSVKKEIPALPSVKVPERSDGGGRSNKTADSSVDRMADPAIKTLRTKYGKEIMLAPDKIVISGNGMSITISDDSGIDIVSNQNVSITADEDLLMSAQNIRITAEKMELKGKENTIILEDKILLQGEEVKMN
ncbi:contractile injection system protein, VgrG/Pvc8 family [Paenibacillus apiarius]|uniref:contractile injection system protein, VgrG/Pvc8 family n=1 Tax=Paenibacillus apiarius TaxID=46240 RepID=UPI003B3BC827